MENQRREMVKTIGETGGLGTVAHESDIIEKLFHNVLAGKEGQRDPYTSKAKQLLEISAEDLKKPELTAEWEMKCFRKLQKEAGRPCVM